MPESESDSKLDRQKLTLWLSIGAAISLILPLLIAAYMHWGGNGGPGGPGMRNDVFEHREGADRRIVPNQALAMPVAPPPTNKVNRQDLENSGSSLDFIKPASEIAGKVAPPAAVPPVAPAPEKTPVAAPPPKAVHKPAPKSKKSFATPKLQPSRGFTKMGGSKNATPTANGSPSQGGSQQDLLKNLVPEAANNPQLQQYLNQHGQGQ